MTTHSFLMVATAWVTLGSLQETRLYLVLALCPRTEVVYPGPVPWVRGPLSRLHESSLQIKAGIRVSFLVNHNVMFTFILLSNWSVPHLFLERLM